MQQYYSFKKYKIKMTLGVWVKRCNKLLTSTLHFPTCFLCTDLHNPWSSTTNKDIKTWVTDELTNFKKMTVNQKSTARWSLQRPLFFVIAFLNTAWIARTVIFRGISKQTCHHHFLIVLKLSGCIAKRPYWLLLVNLMFSSAHKCLLVYHWQRTFPQQHRRLSIALYSFFIHPFIPSLIL